ncbi:hypothetical protein [Novosphingobium album (ex Hu et al. 2023)]|uniref:Uncharacterized protein n=1 Tax=Novosphingobium album (ex Hu et al. 2023) TaxID=2930093 RepID=A0ABT0B8H3_9SPHN|nr:hypothetical protein [Novosphingobium album (ex Hu et al. 2023)]MCJ2181094.1 hypothetical protein [Novosphingobium album (ex Hu et al. 2023)]
MPLRWNIFTIPCGLAAAQVNHERLLQPVRPAITAQNSILAWIDYKQLTRAPFTHLALDNLYAVVNPRSPKHIRSATVLRLKTVRAPISNGIRCRTGPDEQAVGIAEEIVTVERALYRRLQAAVCCRATSVIAASALRS